MVPQVSPRPSEIPETHSPSQHFTFPFSSGSAATPDLLFLLSHFSTTKSRLTSKSALSMSAFSLSPRLMDLQLVLETARSLMLTLSPLLPLLSTSITFSLTLMNVVDSLKSVTNTLLNKFNSQVKNHTQPQTIPSDLTLIILLKNLSGLHVMMTVHNHLTTQQIKLVVALTSQQVLNLPLTDMIASQNVMVPTLTVSNHSNITVTHQDKVSTHTHLPSNLKTTNLLVHAT